MKERITSLSNIYADSLLKSDLNQDTIVKDLETIEKIINSSNELQLLMENPTVSPDKKFEIINEVFNTQINEKMLSFLKLLVEKKRFADLKQIHQAYSLLTDEINNIKRIEVVSAVELTDKQKMSLMDKLSEKYKKKILTDWILDKSIIGGLVIKSDDDIIDCSIKNKLYRLSKI